MTAVTLPACALLILITCWTGVRAEDVDHPIARGNRAAQSPEAFLALANQFALAPSEELCQSMIVAANAIPVSRYNRRPSDDDVVTWRLAEVTYTCEAATELVNSGDPARRAVMMPMIWDAYIGICDDPTLNRLIAYLEGRLLGPDAGMALAALQQVEVREIATAKSVRNGIYTPCSLPLETLRHLAAGGNITGVTITEMERCRRVAMRILDSIDKRQSRYGYIVPTTVGPIIGDAGLPAGITAGPDVLVSLDAPAQNLSPRTKVQIEVATITGATQRTMATVSDLCGTFPIHARKLTNLSTKTIPDQMARWVATGSWITRVANPQAEIRQGRKNNDQYIDLVDYLRDYDAELNRNDTSIAAIARERTNLLAHFSAIEELINKTAFVAENEPLLLPVVVELRELKDSVADQHARVIADIEAQQELQKQRRKWVSDLRDRIKRMTRP